MHANISYIFSDWDGTIVDLLTTKDLHELVVYLYSD